VLTHACIRYNVLNLPDTIQFGNGRQIINSYDAGGHKLTTQYYTPIGTVIIPKGGIHGSYTTANSVLLLDDYCGSYLYENGTSASVHPLTKILTPEGYWQNSVFYYYLKDHQGNTRAVINSSGTVMEYSDYYPDGMRFEASTSNSAALPYRYNGKELEAMNGLNEYDYGARRRETGIPVWTTMDQKSETYYNWSPYVYCKNNLIKLIDSNGKQPGDPLSTGVPAQQQSNGTWTMAQASTYIPTHQILETKTISLEDRLKTMLPPSSGTITATETNLQKTLDATADNPMTQLETSPVIQGVAAVSAVAMVGAAAPEIISAAVSAVTETAVSVTTAVSNSTTLTAIAGVSAGFVNSQLPQDVPQVTATPIFNTFQAGSQAFFVFMQLLTTSNQKPQPPKKDEKH